MYTYIERDTCIFFYPGSTVNWFVFLCLDFPFSKVAVSHPRCETLWRGHTLTPMNHQPPTAALSVCLLLLRLRRKRWGEVGWPSTGSGQEGSAHEDGQEGQPQPASGSKVDVNASRRGVPEFCARLVGTPAWSAWLICSLPFLQIASYLPSS